MLNVILKKRKVDNVQVPDLAKIEDNMYTIEHRDTVEKLVEPYSLDKEKILYLFDECIKSTLLKQCKTLKEVDDYFSSMIETGVSILGHVKASGMDVSQKDFERRFRELEEIKKKKEKILAIIKDLVR